MRGLVFGLGRLLLRLRYRICVRGLQEILAKGDRGILFLPNHPALIDPVILLSELYGPFAPRSLADRDRLEAPVVRALAHWLRVIPMLDPGAHGLAARADVARALGECAEALQAGDNLILYPSGHLQSSYLESIGGNAAVESILKRVPECRVVLVRTRGLWGSRFSLAGGESNLLRGFLTTGIDILKSLLLFAPRRVVTLDFLEPEDFPREGGRQAQNRFLEAYFNDDAPRATYVPRTLWEQRTPRPLPEPIRHALPEGGVVVPPAVRERVFAQLTRLTGVEAFRDDQDLDRDLGLDSLCRLELATWLESEFQVVSPDPARLEMVADLLMAAAGEPLEVPPSVVPPPPGWFDRPLQPVTVPEGDTVLDAFLNQAARDPKRPVLADQVGGMKTYGDLRTAIFVLRPFLQAMEGSHIGIMLPASGGAATLFLAVMAAGKIPVMVNWTAGSRSMRYGLDLLEVKHVLTSRIFVDRLEARGTDLQGVKDRLLRVEELRRQIGLGAKVTGALKARFAWRTLLGARLPETAVVLFTSGSETHPKAVPLSHRNLVANVQDMHVVVDFRTGDRFLGFLPPFHSFGLTCTTLLPILSGIPVVYHPNPTEGAALARMTEVYRASILIGTPTFLQTITRVASDAQLRSMRIAVTGAERCPQSLYDTLARRWPEVLVLEGYGITECSPVVSVNRESDHRPGTIGLLLPSVEGVVVDPDTLLPVPEGERGMLLVKGPSIFGGYLKHEGPSPFEAYGGEAWYRTGDLVRVEAGHLVFAGRLKRFVKLGGEMVSLPAVEEILLKAFPLVEGEEGVPLAVEATPEEGRPDLVLFTVRDIARDEANAVLKASGLSPLHFIRQVRRVESIPLLGSGKTDYRSLKALLA